MVSEIVATCAEKRPKVVGSVALDVPSREVACLNVVFYAFIESCELK